MKYTIKIEHKPFETSKEFRYWAMAYDEDKTYIHGCHGSTQEEAEKSLLKILKMAPQPQPTITKEIELPETEEDFLNAADDQYAAKVNK